MPGAAPEVIGRDDELAALEAFLDADSELRGSLLLEGETGMGKTTLWERGVAAARERGFRVLSCRTSPSEATFSSRAWPTSSRACSRRRSRRFRHPRRTGSARRSSSKTREASRPTRAPSQRAA